MDKIILGVTTLLVIVYHMTSEPFLKISKKSELKILVRRFTKFEIYGLEAILILSSLYGYGFFSLIEFKVNISIESTRYLIAGVLIIESIHALVVSNIINESYKEVEEFEFNPNFIYLKIRAVSIRVKKIDMLMFILNGLILGALLGLSISNEVVEFTPGIILFGLTIPIYTLINRRLFYRLITAKPQLIYLNDHRIIRAYIESDEKDFLHLISINNMRQVNVRTSILKSEIKTISSVDS